MARQDMKHYEQFLASSDSKLIGTVLAHNTLALNHKTLREAIRKKTAYFKDMS